MTRTATLLSAAAAAALVLLGCTPTVETTPTASPTDITPTVSESPTPTPEASEPASGLSQSDYDNIAASINSGNTAALEGYLSEPVGFVLAASECCDPLSRVEAINGLDYLDSATGPWTYPVSEAVIDAYRAGFYVDSFPEGVFVMHSADADPYVLAFEITGAQITGIFIGGDSLLREP